MSLYFANAAYVYHSVTVYVYSLIIIVIIADI
jgi:hypothetical protein